METISVKANMKAAENCIILLNTATYVVSRVDTVNCNEAGGWGILIRQASTY